MLIVNDRFRIFADDNGYTLKERKITLKGDEVYQICGYYSSLDKALSAAKEYKLRRLLAEKEVHVADIIAEMEDRNE